MDDIGSTRSRAALSGIEQRVLAVRDDSLFDRESHHIGGSPSGIGPRGLPVCTNCHRPLAFALQIDTHDSRLGIQPWTTRHLYVLTCPSCDTQTCDHTHYASSRSGRSLRLVRQPAGHVIDAEHPRTWPELRLEILEDAEPAFDGPFHQWGGDPIWLGDALEPSCTSCRSPMTFVLQIDSEPENGVLFADHGMLYAFACFRCHQEVATIVQTA